MRPGDFLSDRPLATRKEEQQRDFSNSNNISEAPYCFLHRFQKWINYILALSAYS